MTVAIPLLLRLRGLEAEEVDAAVTGGNRLVAIFANVQKLKLWLEHQL